MMSDGGIKATGRIDLDNGELHIFKIDRRRRRCHVQYVGADGKTHAPIIVKEGERVALRGHLDIR